MTGSDMSSIERRVTIRAPQSRVWRAITDPADFGDWFGVTVKGAFHPGAQVEMTSTHKGHEGMTFTVHIDRIEPEHFFSWHWHPGRPDQAVDYSNQPMTTVEFRLEETGGATLVTVTETWFDRISLARRAAVYKDNVGGWEHQMKSLAQYAASQT